ncbi:MAG: hypothetical protein ABSE04_03405 [Candidatus Microgenomates bacterium]|jgi:4-amino-4-deoxy-L-arabinose transferase-like glycosyltransferase
MFLTFSDAAKFADIARMLVSVGKYGLSFSFWTNNLTFPFSAAGVGPFMPFSIALFFKIFGVNDFTVVATSLFYFLLTLIFVFLLSKKVFKSDLIGILSVLAVGFNYDLINYATDGASEAPFIFEIVVGAYFISLRKKWATGVAVLFLVLLYFTRPLAFIYIAGLILFYLLQRFSTNKAVLYFLFVSFFSFLVDKYLISSLNGKYFLYSIFDRGLGQLSQNVPVTATSVSLRGAVTVAASSLTVFKNTFYNLYNFYKLLPQIMSPYLFALFLIGVFRWGKDKLLNSLKGATIFMVIVTFLVTAASTPLIRYLHPVVPLIYIFAIETLVWIIGKIFNNHKSVVIVSTILILFLCVGQTLGVIFLDSRFEANTHNAGKPPVYVSLSEILKENTQSSQVVITNLDTWGSWYGERKTVWFPLEPGQLIDSATGKIPFDAIYLTSYLIDDPNYHMGTDWREIFDNPTNPKKWTCDGCGEISKEFKLKGTYKVPSSDDYEKEDASAILLVKR